MAPVPVPSGPSCSDWSRAQQLDPVGSAGNYHGFLLVEQPLPWPADLGALPELAELAQVASAAELRLQAVVPSTWRPVGPAPHMPLRRLVVYRTAEPGWAGPMDRAEVQVAAGAMVQAARELLSGRVNGSGSHAGEQAARPARQDVLVCTHGSRDTCCGSRGIGLVQVLGAPQAGQAPGFSLWRTSHTGGHRFAPTVVMLPSATLWAYADAHLVRAVSDGSAGTSEVLAHYRGCATLGPPEAQALEREVLCRSGLSLLSARRRAVDLGHGRWRLDAGALGVWDAEVRPGRTVPQPDCRAVPSTARKWSTEWVVEALEGGPPA